MLALGNMLEGKRPEINMIVLKGNICILMPVIHSTYLHMCRFKGVDAYKKASEQHVKVRVMGICKSCQLIQTKLIHIFAPLIIEHSP